MITSRPASALTQSLVQSPHATVVAQCPSEATRSLSFSPSQTKTDASGYASKSARRYGIEPCCTPRFCDQTVSYGKGRGRRSRRCSKRRPRGLGRPVPPPGGRFIELALSLIARREPCTILAERRRDPVWRNLPETRCLTGGAQSQATRLAEASELEKLFVGQGGVVRVFQCA